ncbi:MAG: energy-coupling factor transporter ATPase [Eubacteriales bacterium]|nr:energy-coupling factor transporter ATPase [Eubacteriales bacterium]
MDLENHAGRPPFANIDNVSFLYQQHGHDPIQALSHVTLDLKKGSHTAILGRNGSGKSTLARLINALELPSEGTIIVAGYDTQDDQNIWEVRRQCGMVFQNPDNQIVGTTVEEDVAFGPENLGFPQPEIRLSVDKALVRVNMLALAERPPHLLSGGQKQKLAIAGILAMQPSCLILDEATSMLDPATRTDFMALVAELIQEQGLTVINITHHMEEALLADRVVIMNDGHVILSGSPSEVFDRVQLVKSQGLDVPVHGEILNRIAELTAQKPQPFESSEWESARKAVVRLLKSAAPEKLLSVLREHQRRQASAHTLASLGEPVIRVENLSFTYSSGTTLESKALQNVSFDVRKGELLGIIGHSGSGKSTLIQHLNGLLRTQSGKVTVLGHDASENQAIRRIRRHVGLLFQYPEHQLFEETVFQDIAFGPRRLGLDAAEVEKRVLWAARIVGLTDEELERSPFELSGGQRRRAAIAGVIAMRPEVLILDEPAAGLDPAGREEILGYAARLRDEGSTVILVSHSMEDVARLSDRVLALKDGAVLLFGTPAEVFAQTETLVAADLSVPRTAVFLRDMKADFPDISDQFYTVESAAFELIRAAVGRCES